jgi:hypothetical protein
LDYIMIAKWGSKVSVQFHFINKVRDKVVYWILRLWCVGIPTLWSEIASKNFLVNIHLQYSNNSNVPTYSTTWMELYTWWTVLLEQYFLFKDMLYTF